MLCSLSGTVPVEAVFSLKSGHVYEKRLVMKHVEAAGTEPVSGEPCTADDFVPVKSNTAVKPKPLAATSISGLLGTLQSEWDGLMLETFQLRTTLENTRSELSQALYQHDAACRVIARLIKERDQARATLTSTQAALASRAAGGAAAAADVDMSAESAGSAAPAGLTQETLQQMTDKYKELTKSRKKRAIPAETATAAGVASIASSASYTPHSPTTPGLTCLEGGRPGSAFEGLALTGGADKMALLFDLAAGRVLARLQGHEKAVSSVAFSGCDHEVAMTTSADCVRVWTSKGASREAWSEALALRPHASDLVGVAALPSGDFAVTAARDGSVSLLDTAVGRVLAIIPPPKADAAAFKVATAVRLHPDGLLVGVGANDGLRFIDLRSQSVAANIPNKAHEGRALTGVAFSENGYIAASAGEDGSACTWDLRKAAPNTEPLVRRFALPAGAGGATALSFDLSGCYLAVGSATGTVAVWDVRDAAGAAPLRSRADHSGAVTGLAWGAHARSLVSSGMDRALSVLSIQ